MHEKKRTLSWSVERIRDISLRVFLTCFFALTVLFLALAVRNLLQWMRQSDLMFGHYKGPPQLILSAGYWARWATGFGIVGTMIYVARVWRSVWNSEISKRRFSLTMMLFGTVMWLGCVAVGMLVWGMAAEEAPYAKLQIQRETIEGLSAGDPHAPDQAQAALSSTDWLTRQRGAEAMKRLDSSAVSRALPDLIRAVESGDTLVAVNAAQAIARLGPAAEPAVPVLIEVLARDDVAIRVAAAEALADIGEPAFLQLAERLVIEDPQTRAQALFAFRFFDSGSEAILERVRPLLKDPDLSVRESAAATWTKLAGVDHSADSITALLVQLRQSDQTPPLNVLGRLASAGWLAYEAVPLLEPLLDGPQVQMRLPAAQAIWRICGRSSPILEITTEMLRSGVEDQRRAILLLSSLGPLAEKQLDQIRPLQQHPDRGIANLATNANYRIRRESQQTPQMIREQLAEDSVGLLERGLYQVEIRGDLAAEFVPEVARLLKHDSTAIRMRSLKALVRMGPTAITASEQIEALADEEHDLVRQVAAQTLLAIRTLYGE